MKSGHRRIRWMLLPAVAMFALVYPVQLPISRNKLLSQNTYPITNVREGGTVALMAMIGGFRPMVVNLLWLKSDQYWHAGSSGWWRIVGVLQTICEMDPHFLEAWSTFGWHCAWNIAAEAAPQDKARWVETGVEVYKRGISFNPDRYDLYKDLAWLYQDHNKDFQSAIPWWQKALNPKFRPHAPMYVRHMLAHAYECTYQWQKAVAVWKECVKQDPKDLVARSAVDWWAQQAAKPDGIRKEMLRIWQRENAVRKNRGIPLTEQPFTIR